MQKTEQLTIELPAFQMEIIKRAAFYNRVSPAQFVLDQLNIESMESYLNTLIADAAQGYIAERVSVRCERCQYTKVLGAGATTCGRCQYDFPEPCSDEVHQSFANLWESEDEENFHCGICNKWIVRKNLTPNEQTESDQANNALYAVSLSSEPFVSLSYFVEVILPETDPELAARVSDGMIDGLSALWCVGRQDIDDLRDKFEQYIDFCKKQTPPPYNMNDESGTGFISLATRAIEEIRHPERLPI